MQLHLDLYFRVSSFCETECIHSKKKFHLGFLFGGKIGLRSSIIQVTTRRGGWFWPDDTCVINFFLWRCAHPSCERRRLVEKGFMSAWYVYLHVYHECYVHVLVLLIPVRMSVFRMIWSFPRPSYIGSALLQVGVCFMTYTRTRDEITWHIHLSISVYIH